MPLCHPLIVLQVPGLESAAVPVKVRLQTELVCDIIE